MGAQLSAERLIRVAAAMAGSLAPLGFMRGVSCAPAVFYQVMQAARGARASTPLRGA
jgi:hypothetical protein